jgi:hypothetical protein
MPSLTTRTMGSAVNTIEADEVEKESPGFSAGLSNGF